ncbi:MAG TPA: IPT/TIG domain-containing protein [Myxococcaceae bacterium]|nr:IPT/TIG domain-containing protein [Myxococcaceae bacterium]
MLALAGCSQAPTLPNVPALIPDSTASNCWAGDCSGTFIGAAPQGTIQLQNKGLQTVNITSVSLTGDSAFGSLSLAFAGDAGLSPPVSIPGEKTAFLSVFFTPTAAKQYNGTITIASNSQATVLSGGATSCGASCVITLGGKGIATPPPDVQAVVPVTGPPSGGTQVTISGNNFFTSHNFSVMFGPNAATQVNNPTDRSITCVSPAQGVGVVPVIVTDTTTNLSSDGGVTFKYCVPIGDAGC